MPFKRYEIGRVFRDGPIKLGRYREFWQCDVDICGTPSVKAESELILLALDAFQRLGLDAYLEINNRKLLYGMLDYCKVPVEKRESVIVSIDKMEKYGLSTVKNELLEKELSLESIDKIIETLSIRGDNEGILTQLKGIITSEMGMQGVKEMEELLSYLKFLEHGRVILNISLARGLNYYTGTVFEGFLKDSKVTSSICGGGRYDNMIGMFAQNAREYPAVGISFGLEPIIDALKLIGIEQKKTVTQLYIIPIKTFKESIIIATRLREAGILADIDLMERGISKNLDYANAMSIPYVAFIGEHELSEKKLKLKNMKTGKEEFLKLEDVYEHIVQGR
jgi:histidyl-tRNA synthetase